MKLMITLFFLTLFCAPVLEAQNFVPSEVEISQEKVKLSDGTVMYVHKVSKGQTVFSIAKKYAVTVEEIRKYNSQIPESGDIKTGEILFIPCAGEMQSVEKKDRKPETPEKSGKETRSRKEKKEYRKHKVKWYESLEEIADRYQVSAADILALNGLTEDRIKSRMILLIPEPGQTVIPETGADTTAAATGITESDRQQADLPEEGDSRIYDDFLQDRLNRGQKDLNHTFKISLILPFKADGSTGNADRNYMDFYSGSLMAVRRFKEMGMKIELQVIDLARYHNSVYEIVSSGLLEGSEFILGPIKTKELSGLLSYCESRRIPLISPLSPDAESLAEVSDIFIQATPSIPHLKQKVFDEFTTDNNVTSHMMVFERGAEGKKQIEEFILKGELTGTVIDSMSYGILQGRTILGKLKSKMVKSEGYLNKVFIPSENQAFVADVIRNLYLAKLDGYNIQVYGMPSWKNFNNIEVSLYHNLNVTLCTAYHIDYSDPEVDRFVTAYKTLFKADPTQFAFQGYDLTGYFLDKVFNFQNYFLQNITGHPENLLQSNMDLRQLKNGGKVNAGCKHIVYDEGFVIREIK